MESASDETVKYSTVSSANSRVCEASLVPGSGEVVDSSLGCPLWSRQGISLRSLS